MSSSNESKKAKNTISPDEEDFLTEDPEISSQKIVLLSFLSPEKVLANKDLFFFKEFVRDYDLQWKTSKLEAWMASQLLEINNKLEAIAGDLDKRDLSGAAVDVRSRLLRVDAFVENFQEYKRKALKELKQTDIQTDYDDFMFKNSAKLEDQFHQANDFHTTIRGIKVRGVYGSEAEAQARAKRLQKSDPNFNIFMGAVGKWMAWDPEPSRVPNQEYANEQLNTLMSKYRDNEEARDQFYTEQKSKRIGQARTRKDDAENIAGVSTSNVIGDGQENTSNNDGSSSSSNTTSYDGLFSGPADLALQRKLERQASQQDK